MEKVVRGLPEIKSVTPRFQIDGEYIRLDGAKKCQVSLGMLFEGVMQKTEAGKTIDGANQILLPLSLAKPFDENVNNLIGMNCAKVFLLFSLKSILIGFWGAMSGVIGAMLVSTLANIFLARTYLESFEGYNLFAFKLPSALFVIGLVCLIAFAAGVLPAFRASRLNPIEALRYE